MSLLHPSTTISAQPKRSPLQNGGSALDEVEVAPSVAGALHAVGAEDGLDRFDVRRIERHVGGGRVLAASKTRPASVAQPLYTM